MTSQGGFTGVRFITFFVAVLAGHAQTAPISIRVVQGDHAINSIKLRQGHDPVVQLTDPAGAPIAGATVTFMLPASGPGATFPDQSLSSSVQTDQQGMAA